jgi:hypothetical protein
MALSASILLPIPALPQIALKPYSGHFVMHCNGTKQVNFLPALTINRLTLLHSKKQKQF